MGRYRETLARYRAMRSTLGTDAGKVKAFLAPRSSAVACLLIGSCDYQDRRDVAKSSPRSTPMTNGAVTAVIKRGSFAPRVEIAVGISTRGFRARGVAEPERKEE